MAYKIDRPETNGRIEQWANITTDQLVYALNDLDRRCEEILLEASTIQGNVAQLQDKEISGELYQMINKLSDDLTTLSGSIDTISGNIETINQNYTALEARVTALEGS